MKKKIIVCIICFVVLLTCGLVGYFLLKNNNQSEQFINLSWDTDGKIHVLTSIDDEIVGDSMWCGTFQLVWNDMVNEVVKKDVEFNPQLKIVENLNKQTFTNKQLSPSSYYSKFGLVTLDLKAEIEKGIKKKFNETSDILDQLDWSNVPQNNKFYKGRDDKKYLFYAMLKKIFNFENVFDERDNGMFADKYENIKYFGIKGSSDSKLYKQVYVYYYNSDEDFAVALKTKEGENIILVRGMGGNSFMEIYNNVLKNEGKYKGKHYFTEDDYLKVPQIEVKTLEEFSELEHKIFYASNGDMCNIEKALQTIEIKLDKEGGEIKSEALIAMAETSALYDFSEIEHRYFYFDKPYVMFLKEEDKDLPYFAAQISDITLFQE